MSCGFAACEHLAGFVWCVAMGAQCLFAQPSPLVCKYDGLTSALVQEKLRNAPDDVVEVTSAGKKTLGEGIFYHHDHGHGHDDVGLVVVLVVLMSMTEMTTTTTMMMML
jgi:hypothetical protein